MATGEPDVKEGARLWRAYLEADGYESERRAYQAWHNWRANIPFRYEQQARKEAGK